MPKAAKSPEMWYARALQFRALADELGVPTRRPRESIHEFNERVAVVDLTRQRLVRDSEKCWAHGGAAEIAKAKQSLQAATHD